MQALRATLPALTTTLHHFASSTSTFQLLKTISATPPPPPPKTLYILDSSFNPPTLAHLHLLTSALLPSPQPVTPPKRVLLLLSTQNADKAPKPASFEHRLVMMELFARDLLFTLPKPQTSTSNEQQIAIDIGITKLPYFHSKSASIEESGVYPPETTQIHLLGYDTLIRLLDTKYYPPEHSLSVLEPFLAKHRLRVTYRGGERGVQDAYLKTLGDGGREDEGGKREWVEEGRIVLVHGIGDGEGEGEGDGVSSTRVRGAVRGGRREELGRLVTVGVREWVLGEGLYLDGE
ncbi:Nucleotidylyl transferase [Mollisia scopiformis]|uniref:Nucleotidylyl transferase n=1 Tax=Mollisia scopiformis TaxID=149040 RepID=A0A194WWW9_MOLSC|nr:Nucleotidylyl transferase [Mollisia scopiformis]KUJ12082.1 Nucleotidylyl transferase [Mollisia scopiformis]